MKALTLHRPWAWAIAHADKRVENRGWQPPDSLLGQRFAIHAGLKYAADAAEWIRREVGISVPSKDSMPAGVIVATVRLVGYIDDDLWIRPDPDDDAHMDAVDESPWFCGPIGWVLDDVRALAEPVACKGAQGLWTVPADVEARIAGALAGERSWQPTLFGSAA